MLYKRLILAVIFLSLSAIASYIIMFISPIYYHGKYICDSTPKPYKEFFFLHEKEFYSIDKLDADKRKTLSIFVTRKLIGSVASIKDMNNLEWMVNFFLCHKFVEIFFEKKEIILLYAYYMPFENGYGIKNSAKYYFHKTVTELTTEELLRLITISKAPSKYTKVEPGRVGKIPSDEL